MNLHRAQVATRNAFWRWVVFGSLFILAVAAFEAWR